VPSTLILDRLPLVVRFSAPGPMADDRGLLQMPTAHADAEARALLLQVKARATAALPFRPSHPPDRCDRSRRVLNATILLVEILPWRGRFA
jgi:hypothetical protein